MESIFGAKTLSTCDNSIKSNPLHSFFLVPSSLHLLLLLRLLLTYTFYGCFYCLNLSTIIPYLRMFSPWSHCNSTSPTFLLYRFILPLVCLISIVPISLLLPQLFFYLQLTPLLLRLSSTASTLFLPALNITAYRSLTSTFNIATPFSSTLCDKVLFCILLLYPLRPI